MSASKNRNGSLLFFDSLVSYGPMHEGETLNATLPLFYIAASQGAQELLVTQQVLK